MRIEADGMREDNGIGDPMRHIGGPAKHMAQTVMQTHRHRCQGKTRQVCAEQHFGTRVRISSILVASQ